MCPYHLTVFLNQSDLRLTPTSFYELDDLKKSLSKFLSKQGERIKLKDSSIKCVNYQDDYGSILFAENTVDIIYTHTSMWARVCFLML